MRRFICSVLCAVVTLIAAQPSLGADAAPMKKIKVGAYALALQVQGHGPTVVIDSGANDGPTQSGSWQPIVTALTNDATVYLYDRAGLGDSEPLPEGALRTAKSAARDLHELLAQAKAPRPYVLVAHSIGGLYARVFASEYPDEVAGMVLVDSTHPDQEEKWLAALPSPTADEPPAVTRAREFLNNRLANRSGNQPERLDYITTKAEVRAAKSLGDKPLIVLTHNPKWKMVPDLPDDVMERLEQASQKLQAGLCGLSTRSKQIIAREAGHGIPQEDPQLVIAAVREVLKQVKQK